MSARWVVDADHPRGHLVEMSGAEQAQRDTDEAAAADAAAADAARAQRDAQRNARLAKARDDLDAGSLFASLPAAERGILAMLLEKAT